MLLVCVWVNVIAEGMAVYTEHNSVFAADPFPF